jgi:hypothetical protein
VRYGEPKKYNMPKRGNLLCSKKVCKSTCIEKDTHLEQTDNSMANREDRLIESYIVSNEEDLHKMYE